MIILGINSFFEHPAVAVVRDGDVVFAIEDERLTRIKHGKQYNPWRAYVPVEGFYAALRTLGLTTSDLDEIAYSYDHHEHLKRLWKCFAGWRKASLREELAAVRSAAMVPRLLASGYELRASYQDRIEPRRLARIPYRTWDHHLSHAASAAFLSPFDDSLVVVADGSGEDACTSVYDFSGGKLKLLARVSLPHSLGLFYTFVTAHLGFEPFSDEYKVMGLAAYGEPAFAHAMARMLHLVSHGGYRLDTTMLEQLTNLLGAPRKPGEEILQRHKDIARSLQARLEEAVEHVVSYHLKKNRKRHLCLAGGVFLNCIANQRLRRLAADMFVQPAAHDAGTAIGAAALSWIRRGGTPRVRFPSVFLGTSYSEHEIENALRLAGATWVRLSDADAVTRLVDRLLQERTVAVYRGAMEFGPRALGNRSIIASPRSSEMRCTLNTLKGREPFRPLAPIVTAEAFSEFFEGTPNRFMTETANVRAGMRRRIPAVVHADGTARVQTVDRDHDPFLHSVLADFGWRGGVPVLINTSLNVRGGPIVESPHDALGCFYTSGIDCILLGNCFIERGC
jgi:carbamoyltransferase